jgi:hypothetical protein
MTRVARSCPECSSPHVSGTAHATVRIMWSLVRRRNEPWARKARQYQQLQTTNSRGKSAAPHRGVMLADSFLTVQARLARDGVHFRELSGWADAAPGFAVVRRAGAAGAGDARARCAQWPPNELGCGVRYRHAMRFLLRVLRCQARLRTPSGAPCRRPRFTQGVASGPSIPIHIGAGKSHRPRRAGHF